MELTFIGIIDIILSIYAFFKKEELLLELSMFFSVFTAATAINIFVSTTPIWPFEIPVIFWMLKQILNVLFKKTKIDLKKELNENKLFRLLILFVIVLIIGEIFICLSKININYYDYKFLEDRVISFSSKNITQPVRLMLYIIFAMFISLKKFEKTQILKCIKAFEYGCIFLVFWGGVQYITNTFNIEYPKNLFNNNPYISQGYDQRMGNLRRITSISSEPPVLGFTLVAFLPLIFMKAKKSIEKNEARKMKNLILLTLTIICGLVSTSTSFYFGFAFLMFVYFLKIMFEKEKSKKIAELKFYGKAIIYLVVCGVISFVLIILSRKVSVKIENYKIHKEIKNIIIENNVNEENNENSENLEQMRMEQIEQKKKELEFRKSEEKKELSTTIDTLYNLTINKFNSGSGNQRIDQELAVIKYFYISPIFGIGYGTISAYTVVVNLLVNMGILGLFIFVVLLIKVLKTILDNKQKNEYLSDAIIFSIIGMLVGFCTSIADVTYLFFWGIIILGYKYFLIDDEIDIKRKVIGIDARGLDGKRTGITTYIEQIILQLNKLENDENEYILYSCRDINLDFELKSNIKKKVCNAKKGTVWLLKDLPKILYEDKVNVFWGTQHVLPMKNVYTENIKFVVTIHDIANLKMKHIGQLKNEIIQKLFVGYSCKNADKIISDSESTKKDINEVIGIDLNKIETVYLGTNFSTKYDIDGLNENKILSKFSVQKNKYLLFVSTIEPRKNIITLVKAFNNIKEKKEYKDLKLVLAGGLGWRYETILQEIENSPYKNDIIRPGYISNEEKKCLLHNCSAFTYPSLYEGFGLPILEAFANESIVVTSNISSIPEVGEDVALYYNDILNSKELSEVIENALNISKSEKMKRISQGIELTKKFTWKKCARETRRIINNI